MAHYTKRYAIYNGRFKPCTIVDGVHEDVQSVGFSQNIGSLEYLIGHGKVPENEDAFVVDIWTPDTENLKPVLFWIHGGAFVDGASGNAKYNAENLSRNANIVVVSVNYRLGILGTAFFPSISQQNCGFHDIITALEWTNKNISQFGGDSSRITVAGQSSGAWYAMAIHTSPKLQSLFQKTMLFSWPGSMKAVSTSVAEEIYNRFVKEVKRLTTYTSIDEVPINVILAAQSKVGHQNKKKYAFLVPFMPSIEEGFISDNFFEAIKSVSKPLYLQFTKDECGSYVYRYPIQSWFPTWLLVPFMKKYCPENTYQKVKKSLMQTRDAYQTVVEVTSNELFKVVAQKIAAIVGQNCQIHEFFYPTQNNKTKCCHCFDIPFVLGSFDAWKNSRLFENCDFDLMKAESIVLQEKLSNFMQ